MEHPSARDRQRKNASIRFADGLVRHDLLASEKIQNDYTVPLYESFCWSFFQKATSPVKRVNCYFLPTDKSKFEHSLHKTTTAFAVVFDLIYR